MSWMDSWSRPSKRAEVPPPLYLTETNVLYCRTCGRVISARKSNSKPDNEVKYCSDRCRRHKPGPLDKKIEQKILALLDNEEGSGIEKTLAKSRLVKGDRRLIITCDEIEEVMFGSRYDPQKVYGRRKNRASRAIGGENSEWKSVDMDDASDESDKQDNDAGGAVLFGLQIRPPQAESDVNGSIGGERGRAERAYETAEDQVKRLEGVKRAEEREKIRRAARRAVVFGFPTTSAMFINEQAESKSNAKVRSRKTKEMAAKIDFEADSPRKCEALMNGSVVEPSFAKGNWSIRWRE